MSEITSHSPQFVTTLRFGWVVFLRGLLIAAAGLAVAGTGMLGIAFPVPVTIGCVILAVGVSHQRFTSGTFGTARFADGQDLHRAKMIGAGGGGLVIGRADPSFRPTLAQLLPPLLNKPLAKSAEAVRPILGSRSRYQAKHGELIRLERFVHILTVGPSGAGKGVSLIGPTLHLYPSSTVTLDFKGENFSKHAAHRTKAFGHHVVRLDFWNVCGDGTGRYNPLATIDPALPRALDECRALADDMVVRTGHEKDSHFDDSAVIVLCASIAFTVFYGTPEETNLQTVRGILTNPVKFANMAAALQGSDLAGGLLKRLGDSLSHFRDRELGSVMTTVGRHTAFLDSHAVANGMNSTSFDVSDLKAGSLDLFLIVPPDQMSVQRPLLRLIFGSLLRAVTRAGLDESGKVLFLLDEAGQLGKMQVIEDALTLYRGYGVRCWFFYQSLDQVKKCFEHENILLSNVGTVTYLGTNDYSTAEAISKRIGEMTAVSTSRQRGTSKSGARGESFGQQSGGGQVSVSDSVTHAETARQLIKPDELLRLPREELIVFTENLPPIRAKRLIHYRDPEFKPGRLPRGPSLGLTAGIKAAAFLMAAALYAVAAYAVAIDRESAPDAVAGRASHAMP